MSKFTYLTTAELAQRIKLDPKYIRGHLVPTSLIEGVHYIKAFGGRKYLFLWENVESEMLKPTSTADLMKGVV